MDREVNPPDEIIRRIFFVLYIFCWVSLIIVGTIGLLEGQENYLIIAAILFIISLKMKHFCESRLHFGRLAKSFPAGSRIDEIPKELQIELEDLFSQYEKTQSNWIKRQEIRVRLAAIISEDPSLMDVYGDRIRAVHANITGRKSVP